MDGPIDDQRLNRLMNVIYNQWFRKWKSKDIRKWTDDDWDEMIDEAGYIVDQGREYGIVYSLVEAFMSEFDARARAAAEEILEGI